MDQLVISSVSSNKKDTLDIIFAIIYILYGVVKIAIGLVIMIVKPEQIQNIPLLNMLTKEAADKTLAGSMYEFVLMAFGVVTILHGLTIFSLLPSWFEEFFVSKVVQYTILTIFGLIMSIFYSLVLYTDVKIDKNSEYNDHYLLLGLVGGITFLLMPLIWELIEYVSPFFKNLPVEQQNMAIIASIIIIIAIFEIIYILYKKEPETSTFKKIVDSKVQDIDIITSNIPIH